MENENIEKTKNEIKNKSKESFNQIYLIDLSKIIRKFWDDFSIFFKDKYSKDEFKSLFGKVNSTRNKIMHPIKDCPTLIDFETVHQLYLFSNEILRDYDKIEQSLEL